MKKFKETEKKNKKIEQQKQNEQHKFPLLSTSTQEK